MDSIEKFSSDIEKIKKRYRAERSSLGKAYDGLEATNLVADFFEKENRELSSLAHSYGQYWKESYIFKSSALEEEPTAEHVEILSGMFALLNDPENSWEYTESFSAQDWKELCTLTNYEAEDLPLELLSSLMKVFVDNQAIV